MIDDNRRWSETITKRVDTSFKHRWIIYNEIVSTHLFPHVLWIDIGCGQNHSIRDLGTAVRFAVGVDLIPPIGKTKPPYIVADLRALPLKSLCADLITLRFVVEHLEVIPQDFAEINRVLKPGGHIIVLTTNAWSPFIFIPRLLPHALKRRLIQRLYRINDGEVFRTYHRFNSLRRMRGGIYEAHLLDAEFIQDSNFVRKWIFLVGFFWHVVTRRGALRELRSNILAVFKKEG